MTITESKLLVIKYKHVIFSTINLFPSKLCYLNFTQLELVSRCCNPKLQVGLNYSYLFNLRPNIYANFNVLTLISFQITVIKPANERDLKTI